MYIMHFATYGGFNTASDLFAIAAANNNLKVKALILPHEGELVTSVRDSATNWELPEDRNVAKATLFGLDIEVTASSALQPDFAIVICEGHNATS